MEFMDAPDETKLKGILLAIELQSEHPLAEAVVKELQQQNVAPVLVNKINSITGKGISAEYNNKRYLVGNLKLLWDNG